VLRWSLALLALVATFTVLPNPQALHQRSAQTSPRRRGTPVPRFRGLDGAQPEEPVLVGHSGLGRGSGAHPAAAHRSGAPIRDHGGGVAAGRSLALALPPPFHTPISHPPQAPRT